MFVINCDVDHTEKLKFPKTGKKKKKKLKTAASFGDGDDDELYNPVKCTKCSTQVAVFDKDEVYLRRVIGSKKDNYFLNKKMVPR